MESVFDIIGPIMIGPSSSHTAGALKLASMARSILGETPNKVRVHLYGSFAKTYRGHGSDRAIAAGFLGFNTEDERIPNAIDIATEMGVEIEFLPSNISVDHPNTLEFEMTGKSGLKIVVQGISIGGGNIVVKKIDNYEVNLTGNYETLITCHKDHPGIIAKITQIISSKNINIAYMYVSRLEKGKDAMMTIETDDYITPDIYSALLKSPDLNFVKIIHKT
ncbi:L-serine dehydratase, iron-sulfur-dependent, beta subunit [Thermodesulfobium narugense DSM 14796]|uniref:L-serine dehydratase n=1 Tax=Thermodesulfobium narugense DSM 14796 TaxID=747365 RepID=M1E960_9BACT|nr:L-serine ammonia-lyase, iron-sulfur-dependent subunit beta [Thermodesulfobium narugense]AEE14889.1 L-serine dehydratase, iron-sulfur-dependent, beta subunit [Thermodesulfobium narugense DSM 14796]